MRKFESFADNITFQMLCPEDYLFAQRLVTLALNNLTRDKIGRWNQSFWIPRIAKKPSQVQITFERINKQAFLRNYKHPLLRRSKQSSVLTNCFSKNAQKFHFYQKNISCFIHKYFQIFSLCHHSRNDYHSKFFSKKSLSIALIIYRSRHFY